MNKPDKKIKRRQNLTDRPDIARKKKRGWAGERRLTMVLLTLFILGAVLPARAVLAEESGRSRLVVEVIEDIPADERVMIEDQQVPLAGSVTPAPKPRSPGRNPVLWLILFVLAVVLAVREYRRAGLRRLRRNGYREEAERLSGTAGRDKR